MSKSEGGRNKYYSYYSHHYYSSYIILDAGASNETAVLQSLKLPLRPYQYQDKIPGQKRNTNEIQNFSKDTKEEKTW